MKRKIFIGILLIILLLTVIMPTLTFAADVTKTYQGNISTITKEAKPGEKVYVQLPQGTYEGCEIKGYIGGDSGQYLTVNIFDVTTKPYFIMPDVAKVGATFRLQLYEIIDNLVGDLNLDGKRTLEDKDMLHHYVVKWPLDQIGVTQEIIDRRADVNGDGQINLKDVTRLHQSVEGMPVEFVSSKTSYSNTNNNQDNAVKVLDNKPAISLENLSIKGNTKVTRNDKLYLNVKISGEPIKLVTVGIKNRDNPSSVALLSMKDINTNPYIDLANMGTQKIEDGYYYINGIFINPNNSAQYVSYQYEDLKNMGFGSNIEFDLISEANSSTNTTTGNNATGGTSTTGEEALKGVKIDTDKVKLNEKVIVNLETKKDIKQAMLNFEDKENKNTMIVYVKGLDTPQPYFIVPFTTKPGNYELTYVMLRDEKGNKYQYSKDSNVDSIKQYNFDTKITVEDDVTLSEDILTLDNEKITTEITERIKKIQGNAVIEINANTNPIINQGVFEAIKGTSKIVTIKNNDTEWTFSGNDIKDAKNIDTSVSIYKSNEENGISKMIDSGVVLEFAKNGELPGKCLIRVLANKDLNEVLSDNVANVYYYNEDQGNFDKVMLHILKTEDNYYEFYINHNSKYVLTPKEIDNKYVSGSTQEISQNSSNETSSENKNEINVKLIIEIVTIVVCVIVLTLTLSGKILSNKKKSKKEEK